MARLAMDAAVNSLDQDRVSLPDEIGRNVEQRNTILLIVSMFLTMTSGASTDSPGTPATTCAPLTH